MNSDQKNLFSIGEIAKSVGVTRKIILNYEAKGLIVPDRKEGTTGNRYYTIDTFTTIRTIRIFQNLGLTLDEIHGYLNDATDLQPLIQRLENMRNELNMSIEKLQERANQSPNTVQEITIAPQSVYCRSSHTASITDRTVQLRNTALEAMRLHGVDTTRRMYFIEYRLDDTEEILYGIAVPPKSEGESIRKYPKLRAIAIYHHGAYETIPATREKLIAYARKNGMVLSGVCRHLYVEGPPQHKDPSRFITQIILPLAEQ